MASHDITNERVQHRAKEQIGQMSYLLCGDVIGVLKTTVPCTSIWAVKIHACLERTLLHSTDILATCPT